MKEKEEKIVEPLLQTYLIVSQKNGKPCIEIRRVTTDPDIIKTVLECAFTNVPIIMQPTFNNRIRSINLLIEKGIIYREGEEYFFNI